MSVCEERLGELRRRLHCSNVIINTHFAAVAQLDADLEAERSDHASIVTEQREEMAMLKGKLLSVRTEASVDVRFQRAEANAKTGNILRSFRQVENEMELKIMQLKEKLEIEETVSKESEKFLRKKQDGLKAKLEKWNNKFDNDVEELTVQFNQLTKKREANLEILVKLKKRREQEIAEEKARIAAEEAEKEAKLLAEKLKIKMDQAATYINAMVRRYLSRKKAKDAGGGKKGKKGKGKKGKKK